MAQLQKFGDIYAKKIEQKQMKLQKLDKEIKNVEDKFKEQQKAKNKTNKQVQDIKEDTTEDLLVKIRTLENTLDKQKQKYNTALA
jgi:predicted  nucleic acid-binding Zn-ribbon protein